MRTPSNYGTLHTVVDNYGDPIQISSNEDGIYILIDEGSGRRRAAVDLNSAAARELLSDLSDAVAVHEKMKEG